MASTLTAFLDRYRRALAADDVNALAQLVHLPCLIMGPQVHAVFTADELKQALREQLPRTIQWGAMEAGVHEVVIDVPDVVFADGQGDIPFSLYVQAR